MSGTDAGQYVLSVQESEAIFWSAIVPTELVHGTRQEHPVVVYIAGQQGSGKTRTAADVMKALSSRGQAKIVNSDYYKPYHPAYRHLMATADQAMAGYLGPDGQRWTRMAERYLRENQIDVVIETTMQNPVHFRESVQQYTKHGYRAEVVFLAVPEARSRQGIVHRYAEQVADSGRGRLTVPEKHERSYRSILRTADMIDAEQLAASVAVIRPGNVLLYGNHTDSHQWVAEPQTRAAIISERLRPWTADEFRDFQRVQRHLYSWLGPEWHAELQAIDVLARPVSQAVSWPAGTLAPGAPTHQERAAAATLRSGTAPAPSRLDAPHTAVRPSPVVEQPHRERRHR
jgi:predicted ABC-type ATPase